MNIFGQTVSAIFALALLAALGMGGYFAFEYIAALFLSMDAQVARITVVASVVVLLAATIIASSIRQTGKQNMASEIHADRAAVYKQFIEAWALLLGERSRSEKQSVIPFTESWQSLDLPLALYGSPAVIKAHIALRDLVTRSGSLNSDIRKQFAKALMAVRKDIGSDTNGITPEELTGLLLSDTVQDEGSSAGLVSDSR